MFTVDELKIIKSSLSKTMGSDREFLIINKIDKLLNKVDGYNKCLWRFYWDCGRSGYLEGIFKATKKEVEKSIGYEVYFGEVLGKHSEVYGILEKEDITLISDDPIKVMNSEESGFNPLKCIQDLHFYIDDLSVEQLKKFAEANNYKIETDDREEIIELLEEYYKGDGSDELMYARDYALGF